jgi:drug/metabolite transporter (DMT)-like permease
MSPNIIVLITILGWGFGSFLYKGANANLHPIVVSTIALLLYIVLMPIIWLTTKFDHTINTVGVVYALAGSLCMCVGTLGFSYALRSGGAAGSTTILCALYPALTLILSMCFLGETLTIKKGIGIALALISFAILSIK